MNGPPEPWRRVAVVAMGVASPIGSTLESFERNLFGAASGIVSLRKRFVPKSFPVPYAGLVQGPPVAGRHTLDAQEQDATRFALWAAGEALAPLDQPLPFDAILFATSEGNHFGRLRAAAARPDFDPFDWTGSRAESATEQVGRLLLRKGHALQSRDAILSINAACASGNVALGTALHRIRSGEWTRVLVGAVEARCSSFNLLNFHRLGAMETDATRPAREASRPFSSDRAGFVRAEGAAAFVLEDAATAEARGAAILGYVSGFGFTTDAWHLTAGRPDAAGITRAMTDAIRDAGLTADAIDTISAHGTGTRLNDRLETRAIKAVFGERAYEVPVSALKSQTGHAAVAAGAMEAVAGLLALQRQCVGPTLNCDGRDPECDLDYVAHRARPLAVRHLLSNSFGFGGQNACLCFSAGPAPRLPGRIPSAKRSGPRDAIHPGAENLPRDR